ncbi:MAG: DNA-binding protein WhiA [Bacilli bacterium]
MSYTTIIKNEMNNIEYSKAETISELSAIFNIAMHTTKNNITLLVENISLARKIYKDIKSLYYIKPEINKIKINNFKNTSILEITINQHTEEILSDLSLKKDGKRIYIPQNYILEDYELKKAYLRGVFLICGSINDPKTSRYHAEFLIENKKTAYKVNELLNSLLYKSKVIKRDKTYMVYIKEAEKISDFIKLLNAYNALFYYEDIRIYRDHKNMTNRLNNCEQANTEKTIYSSNEQLKNIETIKKNIGLELLDPKLLEVIKYKEKYTESSMQELSDIISTETGKKISKSGINHRFRKIKEIASKLK